MVHGARRLPSRDHALLDREAAHHGRAGDRSRHAALGRVHRHRPGASKASARTVRRASRLPPIVTLQAPGRYFVLRSSRAGAVDVGTPVFFRDLRRPGRLVGARRDRRLRHDAHLRARAVRRTRPCDQPLLERQRLRRLDQCGRSRDRHGVDRLDPRRRNRVRRARARRRSARGGRDGLHALREPRGGESAPVHDVRAATCCASISPCAACAGALRSSSAASRSAR